MRWWGLMSRSPKDCLPERLCFSHHCGQRRAWTQVTASSFLAQCRHELALDSEEQSGPTLCHFPRCPPPPYLHEGLEELVVLLLLPGISHGLLHL